MSYFYETSRVFGALKAVEEQIDWNPSTEQYLNTLDTLLHNGLASLFRCCDYADQQMASMLAWYAETPRHRITSRDKQEALSLMGAFLVTTDTDEKLTLYEMLRPRRTLAFIILDDWLRVLKDYRNKVNLSLRDPDNMQLRGEIRALECSVGYDCTRHDSLYAAYSQVKYWSSASALFKQMILEKYTRLILNMSKRFYTETQQAFPLDDIIQTNCMLALKAIDRCDQRKGTLTTYLQAWINGSRMRKVLVEKDSAFSAGTHQEDYTYKSVFLTDEELEDLPGDSDSEERQDDISHVQKIAHIVDPSGLGRFSLDIGQHKGILLKSDCL